MSMKVMTMTFKDFMSLPYCRVSKIILCCLKPVSKISMWLIQGLYILEAIKRQIWLSPVWIIFGVVFLFMFIRYIWTAIFDQIGYYVINHIMLHTLIYLEYTPEDAIAEYNDLDNELKVAYHKAFLKFLEMQGHLL